jgi:protease-4
MSPLTDLKPSMTGWDPTSQIAVIYIDGVIVDGSSSGGGLLGSRQSGSETVAWQLRQAAEDPSVKAVVLRVDSPGGSAYASDEIARAVSMVQKEGKPVVASFGGVAASGGYYVAAGADTIWAEPNTVTGSIGVYTVKFAAEKMLEKIGIETTSVSRGPHADLYSMTDPWDASERARVEALVEDTYVRFKAIVAEGRGMSDEEVEQVARGRVWSGTDAKDVGLIDQFGGLYQAIEDARARANIPEHHELGLATYQGETSLLESLTPSLLRSSIATMIDTRQEASIPEGLRAALETFGPALVMAAHPEERSWALDARFWLDSSR